MDKEPSKKLLEKQLRRQADEAKHLAAQHDSRRRNVVTMIIIVVIVAGVVALAMKDRNQQDAPVGVAATEAGCTDIERFELLEAAHIEEGASHEPYNSNPPTSGPHYGTPADAGFYPTALATETVVHNLEHGQLVFWYRDGLGQEDLDEIEKITRQEPLATVGLPSPSLESPYNLVMTAWGAMQSCEKVSQAVIDDFRKEFQGRGPENVGVPAFSG